MDGTSKVERLSTEKIGKLLWEMSSQTTFSLLVYAVYSITDTYFLSVGINSLAAAGASIIRANGNIRYSTAIWVIPVTANLVM